MGTYGALNGVSHVPPYRTEHYERHRAVASLPDDDRKNDTPARIAK